MKVAIYNSKGSYPSRFTFDPNGEYPEYCGEISDEPNPVYDAVRNILRDLGYDKKIKVQNHGILWDF